MCGVLCVWCVCVSVFSQCARTCDVDQKVNSLHDARFQGNCRRFQPRHEVFFILIFTTVVTTCLFFRVFHSHQKKFERPSGQQTSRLKFAPERIHLEVEMV